MGWFINEYQVAVPDREVSFLLTGSSSGIRVQYYYFYYDANVLLTCYGSRLQIII